MPTLNDYKQFDGRHYETGVIHNYLAHAGVVAPHTKRPYSEALMLGVSGGIVMGYFTFAYKGYDSHVALLTRNTFSPFDTLLSRLGVERDVRHTNKPDKAVANLVDTLEDGAPAMVWADKWSMPYNAMANDEGMWGNYPLIVHGYDEGTDEVCIADRAAVSLTVTTGELAAARARIKKDKFRLMTMDMPDPDGLPAAVASGIWDCIKLFTEKPPRGAARNFGFASYRNWIELLTRPKQRGSWEKEFPAGGKMYAGLTSAVGRMGMTGICGDAERGLYADFLDEAASILSKPALKDAGKLFRASSRAWRDLTGALAPDDVPMFKETRELMERRSVLFVEKGCDGLPEIRRLDDRLIALRKEAGDRFPLDAGGVTTLRETIAEGIQRIHDIEAPAVEQLRAAMSG